ncbi:putative quinol monooxygenase [Aliikangiella maris]|uniref:Antibiotic biosynthesis monooxygenase n=2 Tax=Aliikangiella maris TaxID=3162458 RepID=A0ABV2BXZ9_9GAMM
MGAVVIVNIEAKLGKSTEALEVIKKSQQLCLSTDGCADFKILQSQEDKHKFSFVERWVSAETHKAFVEQLMSDEAFVASMDVFTSGPEIAYFDEV